nr:hypothetical protein MtrunA17_Chr4g0021101 [Ipomoea batatas]
MNLNPSNLGANLSDRGGTAAVAAVDDDFPVFFPVWALDEAEERTAAEAVAMEAAWDKIENGATLKGATCLSSSRFDGIYKPTAKQPFYILPQYIHLQVHLLPYLLQWNHHFLLRISHQHEIEALIVKHIHHSQACPVHSNEAFGHNVLYQLLSRSVDGDAVAEIDAVKNGFCADFHGETLGILVPDVSDLAHLFHYAGEEGFDREGSGGVELSVGEVLRGLMRFKGLEDEDSEEIERAAIFCQLLAQSLS